MATLLIKNGILVTASDEFRADILVKDGKIEAIGEGIAADADEVYDAAGKYVMPGGVDQHTHFNFKFGDAVVMGWETSCGAVVGGTTTVIDFCNQEVGHSMKYSIDHYRQIISNNHLFKESPGHKFHSIGCTTIIKQSFFF